MGFGRDILYATAAVASSPVWVSSMLRTGKWRTDWLGRFGQVNGNLVNARNPRPLPGHPAAGQNTPTVLIHGVSVGEVNAIRQLVATLKKQHPTWRLVIATTTDTGYRRARELFAAEHSVVRYPFDFSFAVKRFLDAVQPDVVALVELEVWPNFVSECAARGIGVCVINGRLSARSFNRYRWIRAAVRSTFGKLAAVGAQTEADAERFKAIGTCADRVQVLDTMKWDAATLADDVDGADELAAALGIDRTRPVVVAGSTGPDEERLLIEACPAEAQLVLVPRKPERFEAVARLDPKIVRRTQTIPSAPAAESHRDTPLGDHGTSTQNDSVASKPRLFLVDTMGELGKAYALADIAIVGRSFNGLGGSDPIEPIALGKATVIGPDHANFAGVVSALEAGDGLIVTRDVGDTIAHLLQNRDRAQALAANGRAVIRNRQGATRRYATMIESVLETSQPPRARAVH
jgi:3-deoxy-D-manno-octulosonic-acid transferase